MLPCTSLDLLVGEQGMNVARLNMSHGDHKSHKAVVDLIREYNRLDRGNVAIMLDTKGPEVRSGDLAEPIDMKRGPSSLSFPK
jgi:pyruvate kinase